MTKYRLIGTGTTNSQGIATVTYTGVGAGEMDIIASTDSTITDSSLLSEIKELIDCTVCDMGLSTDYNDLFRNMTYFTRAEEATTYVCDNTGGESNYSNYLTSSITLSGDMVVEITVTEITSTPRVQIARYETGVSTTYNILGIVSTGTYRIEILEDSTKWYRDGTLVKTDTNQPNGSFNFFFITNAGTTSDFKYNGFKVYPI